jgi:hypothetical protein
MTTKNELIEQIEDLVRSHIAGVRTAAAAAVERGFATTARAERGAGTRAPRPEATSQRGTGTAAPRRAGEELAALGERFYAALCRQPGETMTTLAPQVGATPRALQVAVARLKRAGRVRAVGQRQHTRYFPLTSAQATA